MGDIIEVDGMADMGNVLFSDSEIPLPEFMEESIPFFCKSLEVALRYVMLSLVK